MFRSSNVVDDARDRGDARFGHVSAAIAAERSRRAAGESLAERALDRRDELAHLSRRWRTAGRSARTSGTARRDDRQAGREVLAQLERVDERHALVDAVRDQADVEALAVGGQLVVRLPAEQVDVRQAGDRASAVVELLADQRDAPRRAARARRARSARSRPSRAACRRSRCTGRGQAPRGRRDRRSRRRARARTARDRRRAATTCVAGLSARFASASAWLIANTQSTFSSSSRSARDRLVAVEVARTSTTRRRSSRRRATRRACRRSPRRWAGTSTAGSRSMPSRRRRPRDRGAQDLRG